MKLLDDYFALQTQIYEHFGYQEEWRIFPLDDSRELFWRIIEDRSVHFSDDEEGVDEPEYSEEIYTYRHLPNWVYRADDYTMIVCNTQCDGNILLRVFDNAKERP